MRKFIALFTLALGVMAFTKVNSTQEVKAKVQGMKTIGETSDCINPGPWCGTQDPIIIKNQ